MPTSVLRGTQSEDDPFAFILSDSSIDRVGDVITAGGWQLDEFKRNPVALFNHDKNAVIGVWKNVRVDGRRLIAQLELAAAGTSALVDTIRSLIGQKILKAVSVGFRPIEFEPIKESPTGGLKFTKQELLEASIVSIPANPNALSLAKSYDLPDALRPLLFAEPGTPQGARSRVAITGKSAKASPNGTKSMNLQTQIENAQSRIVTLKDDLTALAKKIENDEDFDSTEEAIFEELPNTIADAEKRLTTLRAAETALAVKTSTSSAVAAPAVVHAAVMGSPGNRKGQPNSRPSDVIIRMAAANLLSHITRQPLDTVIKSRWKDDDALDAVVKAVVSPARTDVAGWAAEFVEVGMADMLENLTGDSVFNGLAAKGTTHVFGRNGSIKIPRRNTGYPDLRGAFVGENAPIPVRRTSFASILLTPKKMAVISTFSREIAQHSTPAIESIIRDAMRDDTEIAIDVALLDAVAGSVIRPAGLLAGVTPLTATAGGGVNAVTGDLSKLLGPFITANAASGLVFLINPAELLSASMLATAVGVYPFREEIGRGTLFGIPYISSTHIPVKQVILVRAVDFSTAGGPPEFDVSDQATLHEEDASTASAYPVDQTVGATNPPKPIVGGTGATPALADIASPVRSLWQTASIGLRMIMDLDWAMRRSGMVQVVNAVTW